jgi:hypothetical protein
MTNVVNLLDNIQDRTEEEIIRALEGRVHWVSEPFVMMIGLRHAPPNVCITEVLEKMIREGKINKTYMPIPSPDGGTNKLPHYRLAR